MRGTSRGVASRIFRPALPSILSVAILGCTPGLDAAARADTPADSLAALIANVAKANQRLDDLSASVETEQESVNKAIADVETARENAAAAQSEVEASRQGVTDANKAIEAAQHRFDSFAATTYMSGPSASYVTAASPEDVISTAAAAQAMTTDAQTVMANLQRARTEQVNRESTARLAKQKADQAAADAQASQNAAVAALTSTRHHFDDERAESTRLVADRDSAQAKLEAAKAATPAASTTGPANPAAAGPAPTTSLGGTPWSADRWAPGAPSAAASAPGGGRQWNGWDPTLPAIPSANVAGDPVAVINQVLGISATSTQITANMGRNFLQSLGILKPDDTGITNTPRGGRIPRVYGSQASEYVIRRGLSQVGVPYSWGGGNAAGPSKGIDSGSGITGFDCSGLVLYSFAGVGIKLPHYSGSQYNLGRKIPASQMRRGDVIFYGPGGSQHVTLYLGQGQMLEAPDIGLKVRVAPVRTSGMTPYVVRYIEY